MRYPPIENFKKFFTNDMFQAIAEQSTLYATQNGNLTTKFSTCDIEQLTGIRMMMALVPMSRHSKQGKLFIPSALQTKNEEKQAIDEQIIPFRGKHKLKIFKPRKPRRWCGISGMLYDFAFYELCRPKIEKKHALKVSGLGTTDFRTTKACDIITIAWYDNRRVTLTSAYLSIKPVKLKPRWDRKQHKRAMVKVPSYYNMHKGGDTDCTESTTRVATGRRLYSFGSLPR
ncbi:hypothetical protein T4C_2810 [Trichinella pseudospiralis]|uniref:PiggyBac transposable element-derived protein domain-containing protein n=1 Tax=Trichinella pseudospiralis TaxID=6337 RepID=A0A0V1INJ4_TRIPS|nr:hypothetical protein T4C_2810 [Trichinella pseudospiralis]